MKVLRNGVLGLAGLVALEAQAGNEREIFERVARENNAIVVEVPLKEDGTPKYQMFKIGSEYVRGDDNLRNGVFITTLCDSYEDRRVVSNASQSIAHLTRKAAKAAGMKGYEDVLGTDYESVFISEKGETCRDVVVVGTEEDPCGDCLEADGFYKFKWREDGIPGEESALVLVSKDYLPASSCRIPTVPLVVVPEVVVPKEEEAPKGKEEKVNALSSYIAGGLHYVGELGEAASLAGPGIWLESRNGEKFAVKGQVYLTRLNGENGNASEADIDASLGYRFGNQLLVIPSINVDLGTSGYRYADLEASNSDLSLSPQIRLAHFGKKVDLEGSFAYSVLGEQTDSVEGRIFDANQLTKTKGQLEGAYRFNDRFSLGGRAEVEISDFDVESANGDLVPRNNVRTTYGPRAEVRLTDRLYLVGGVEGTDLFGTGQETVSVRPYIGVGSR